MGFLEGIGKEDTTLSDILRIPWSGSRGFPFSEEDIKVPATIGIPGFSRVLLPGRRDIKPSLVRLEYLPRQPWTVTATVRWWGGLTSNPTLMMLYQVLSASFPFRDKNRQRRPEHRGLEMAGFVYVVLFLIVMLCAAHDIPVKFEPLLELRYKGRKKSEFFSKK